MKNLSCGISRAVSVPKTWSNNGDRFASKREAKNVHTPYTFFALESRWINILKNDSFFKKPNKLQSSRKLIKDSTSSLIVQFLTWNTIWLKLNNSSGEIETCSSRRYIMLLVIAVDTDIHRIIDASYNRNLLVREKRARATRDARGWYIKHTFSLIQMSLKQIIYMN